MTHLRIDQFVKCWSGSPFSELVDSPWNVVGQSEQHIRRALATVGTDYIREGDISVHRTATIESGAVLKGPALIGPGCFVAAGAYLRGGVFLDADCTIGPNAELKTSFMFNGTKLAHLNFVGDSILGSDVNIEAGAIIANYRNECEIKRIRICYRGGEIDTGMDKFGALVGDGTRIGANAVVAPGAVLQPGSKVPRLGLVDQAPADT